MTVCETCLLVGIAQGRLKVIQTIKKLLPDVYSMRHIQVMCGLGVQRSESISMEGFI